MLIEATDDRCTSNLINNILSNQTEPLATQFQVVPVLCILTHVVTQIELNGVSVINTVVTIYMYLRRHKL